MTIEREFNDLFVKSGAVFSSCEKYRYKLWRIWDEQKPYVMFQMLNPSIADQFRNDPTVERCERRAVSMGFGGIHVCNIFAWRSTDPAGMKKADDPVGPHNDQSIMDVASSAGMIICAWGGHGRHLNRANEVVSMLREASLPLYYLRKSEGKEPWHPLYLPYREDPKLWLT